MARDKDYGNSDSNENQGQIIDLNKIDDVSNITFFLSHNYQTLLLKKHEVFMT